MEKYMARLELEPTIIQSQALNVGQRYSFENGGSWDLEGMETYHFLFQLRKIYKHNKFSSQNTFPDDMKESKVREYEDQTLKNI